MSRAVTRLLLPVLLSALAAACGGGGGGDGDDGAGGDADVTADVATDPFDLVVEDVRLMDMDAGAVVGERTLAIRDGRIGGIVDRTPHPSDPEKSLNGGSQMVEVSRDGKRIYVTNSLYTPWDDQFYPDGIAGWMAKVDATDDGLAFDPDFFVEFEEGLRSHQVRLEGGDCSSDSFCYS